MGQPSPTTGKKNGAVRPSACSVIYAVVWISVIAATTWFLPTALLTARLLQSPHPHLLLFVRLSVTILVTVVAALFRERVIRNSWYLVAFLLFWIWCINAQSEPFKFVVLGIVILGYFILEGDELAVARVVDKDTTQFRNTPVVATFIEDVRKRQQSFFETREWISVGLAVGLTIASDFGDLKLPIYHPQTMPASASTLFNVFFTTFFLVWIAQAPAKRLAGRNPQGFLAFTRFDIVWPWVKRIADVIDQIYLHAPSEMIVGLFSRTKLLGKLSDLLPSESAYFMHSLNIYGYAYFRSQDRVTIGQGGAASVVNRGVLYITNSDLDSFPRNFHFDSRFKVLSANALAFAAPMVGERPSEEFEAAMDAILRNEIPVSPSFKRLDTPVSVKWEQMIEKPGLGFSRDFAFRPFARAENVGAEATAQGTAIAISYEIRIQVDKGGFVTPGTADGNPSVRDSWIRRVPFPWRQFDVEVELADNVKWYLRPITDTNAVAVDGFKNKQESARVRPMSVGNRGAAWTCNYPLIGGIWEFEWEVWRTDHNRLNWDE